MKHTVWPEPPTPSLSLPGTSAHPDTPRGGLGVGSARAPIFKIFNSCSLLLALSVQRAMEEDGILRGVSAGAALAEDGSDATVRGRMQGGVCVDELRM